MNVIKWMVEQGVGIMTKFTKSNKGQEDVEDNNRLCPKET